MIKKVRILVVDDMETNLLLLSTILKREGFLVDLAHSGDEARSRAAISLPDLVLLDVMMPGEDGFETCVRFRRNEATAQVPIIFLSGHEDLSLKSRGYEVGGDDYIQKPFLKDEVLSRIRMQLLRPQGLRSLAILSAQECTPKGAVEHSVWLSEDLISSPGTLTGSTEGVLFSWVELVPGIRWYLLLGVRSDEEFSGFPHSSSLRRVLASFANASFSICDGLVALDAAAHHLFERPLLLDGILASYNASTSVLSAVSCGKASCAVLDKDGPIRALPLSPSPPLGSGSILRPATAANLRGVHTRLQLGIRTGGPRSSNLEIDL